MKKKWVVLSLVGILVVGGFWYWRKVSAVPKYETVSVVRGDIKETVSASATLVASEEINLNFEITGRIKNVAVKEGQKVGAGETLASLESVALREEVEKAEAALMRAQADAAVNDNTLREAERAERDAKAYYEAVESAEDQKVDAADQAYENAKDYENDAENYYNQVVADEGVNDALSKSARLTLTTATNNRKAADEAKNTARKNRDSAIQYAKNSWNAAKEHTTSIKSSATQTIESSAIAVAESNLAIALANAEKGNIKAPVNGLVTKVNYRVGEVIGTSISSAFGRLLSYDSLLEVKVPESDIVNIQVGQKADVSFDAFDVSDILSAEVIEIEPDATVIQDVVYYIAKLRLEKIDARLKPGMGGDADIHIDEKRGVLELPSRLIQEDGDKQYVSVLRPDNVVERRNIEIGLRGDEGIVEVLSGLSEGDRVISETK